MVQATIASAASQEPEPVHVGDVNKTSNALKGQIDGTLIRPSKRRFFILLMYIILKITNCFHWICMGIITNIVSNFYGTDNMTINWLAILFLVVYVPLALPITWISDYIGLRGCMLVGSFATTLGVIIKCFGCHPDGLQTIFIGHIFLCFADPFFFSVSSNLASVWFPDNQVAMATSWGLIGEQLGDALGFVLPGLMVGFNMYDFVAIESGLFKMFFGNAILVALNTVLVCIFFENQPKYAPGVARSKQIASKATAPERQEETSSLDRIKVQLHLIRELMQNWNFLQLLVGYAIVQGSNYTLHTILNQMIVDSSPSSNWENATAVAGRAGLILIMIGIVGLFVTGFVLDTFHRYKMTAVVSSLLTLVSMALFTLSLRLTSPWVLYAATIPLGFFEACYVCAVFEYAIEITYPKSELVTSTFLNISAALLGIPITILATVIVETFGNQVAGCAFCGLFAITLLLISLQGGDLRRQRAISEEFCVKS